jgi:hypothetical protein
MLLAPQSPGFWRYFVHMVLGLLPSPQWVSLLRTEYVHSTDQVSSGWRTYLPRLKKKSTRQRLAMTFSISRRHWRHVSFLLGVAQPITGGPHPYNLGLINCLLLVPHAMYGFCTIICTSKLWY